VPAGCEALFASARIVAACTSGEGVTHSVAQELGEYTPLLEIQMSSAQRNLEPGASRTGLVMEDPHLR
jgi:hypothetical protein